MVCGDCVSLDSSAATNRRRRRQGPWQRKHGPILGNNGQQGWDGWGQRVWGGPMGQGSSGPKVSNDRGGQDVGCHRFWRSSSRDLVSLVLLCGRDTERGPRDWQPSSSFSGP